MADIFDAMHRAMFDQFFSLDEGGREAKAKLLREAGVPEEMIAELTRPGIQPGMSFGGAKTVDVQTLVERGLFGQNAGSVLLRVTRPPYDEAGHIEVTVLEIGPRLKNRGPRTNALINEDNGHEIYIVIVKVAVCLAMGSSRLSGRREKN